MLDQPEYFLFALNVPDNDGFIVSTAGNLPIIWGYGD
jgi:hypothetical protein